MGTNADIIKIYEVPIELPQTFPLPSEWKEKVETPSKERS